jgi:hypothetical protein
MLSVTGLTGQYAYDGPHGAASTHIFCTTCATRIANRNSLVPGMIILRARHPGSQPPASADRAYLGEA